MKEYKYSFKTLSEMFIRLHSIRCYYQDEDQKVRTVSSIYDADDKFPYVPMCMSALIPVDKLDQFIEPEDSTGYRNQTIEFMMSEGTFFDEILKTESVEGMLDEVRKLEPEETGDSFISSEFGGGKIEIGKSLSSDGYVVVWIRCVGVNRVDISEDGIVTIAFHAPGNKKIER